MNSGRINDIETEVVVIGGGGSGLAAAVTMREKGADVVVLEKRVASGGNAAMAGGPLGAESRLQKQKRIDARRDELFKIQMEYTHWQINPRVFRAFLDKSADTIQWLEDKGVTFGDVHREYPNQLMPTYHGGDLKKGDVGKFITKALVKSCNDTGVRFLHRTPGKKILLGKSGEVTGVLASAKGEQIRIKAKSVVIGTGGYAGNKEMLKKYCPSYPPDMYLWGLPHMGDGLVMALEIGAATEGLGVVLLMAPSLGKHMRKFPLLTAMVGEPDTLWVNNKGERFVDESVSIIPTRAINPIMRQPDKTSFTIFDSRLLTKAVEEGMFRYYPSSGYMPATRLTALEEEIRMAANNDYNLAKISGSWEGIAEWIGAKSGALNATLDEYNSICDKQHDDIFAKEQRYLQALRTSPYYAVKCSPVLNTTMGGIKINHHMEVLNQNDDPIPGLYAVGDVTGGWEWDSYNIVLSGSALGFALNSGRIAGENAVRYASGK